ncbi:MAG: cob(I)yrinic acid a,c-diamide adenosyltransferase [Sulfuricaulis sp.]|uniref:cob(I)yrinic acid a,c-diamide adenosyltransferase n=1 Tax=Sulfuricaulis sp. TaxID=2003553 RepID=UPI0025E2FA84|nr:cob(I)yrinic acid a,c-diamide adenosyltransferase [Sulfuricaulis sp.]MCR4346818.1 cob(I)yrinic acid a,c-diamide adenosyltransferase [Sulfuricaulis sp.]
MGHRLSKIYTRTGDDGTTGLGDGARVKKTSPRVEAMGAVDELNSVIGILLTQDVPEDIQAPLTDIQHELFDLGGELSIPGRTAITEAQVERLEATLDQLNAGLSPLKEFILPGGSQTSATCHLARAICRRAERRTHALSEVEKINVVAAKYLNRLSDLLFVMARVLNARAGRGDVLWQPGKNR